jgi:hypothetical protein
MAASGNLGEWCPRPSGTSSGLRLRRHRGSSWRSCSVPSDLDIAILGKDVDTFELAGRLSLATHREVDVVDLARAPIPLLDAILREGVVLFERTHGSEGRFRSHALSMLETDRPWYERMQNAWLKRVAERGVPWSTVS